MRISDWSSDVCSSDLQLLSLRAHGANHLGWTVTQAVDRPALHKIQISLAIVIFQPGTLPAHKNKLRTAGNFHQGVDTRLIKFHFGFLCSAKKVMAATHAEIGRASCRERVCQYV